MGIWMTVAQAAAAANLLLVGAMGAVWLRNYRRHGASHTLAYLVFAAFLLVENAIWLYLYFLDDAFVGWYAVTTPTIQVGMALLCGLETLALVAIARITLV
ncbi:hypothetical protein [Halapricum hydrolyticum]|uniref:Uncharacterized protein n=1 Tax=Halapricum hydrolyticum TaxID=2979991 RepID=A0AAE3LGV6_9EURY|nr:hypothetical protein [Halapricum hydrolyticum]MCU4717237.1 hypothetical protein [Halapricum hydrolyticum]MCU4726164.1 hypothetical protein [Halapricum hydrolyticum]